MRICDRCQASIPDTASFCPNCGTEVFSVDSPTVDRPPARPTPSPRDSRASSDSFAHGRFLPGKLLGERYRIVAMLGHGGMGEVYRADDLTLGQPVALKFLPKDLAADPARLERFRKEVRSARQVSHPNVCRVYDIGEVDGEQFLSMEYVEGEDLAHLVRRIGALPEAKALEVARQIAAGLAAAHDKGLVHRDLKPANVMLDERGIARVTDFGLAGTAEDFPRENVREGTPHYMAPEQLAGEDVSFRSDIYSLGLVLYELFTGRRAFEAETLAKLVELRESASTETLSNGMAGLDPAIRRVIARCLEHDPWKRPPSALAVSAALPGGDPLAAALAAGETPSPALVAAGGDEALVRPAFAVAMLLCVIVGTILLIWFRIAFGTVIVAKVEYAPSVMKAKAREMLGRLGYGDLPGNDVGKYFFEDSDPYFDYIEKTDKSVDRWKRLDKPGPPLMKYWFRDARKPLVNQNFFDGFAGGNLWENGPALNQPGMILVDLDAKARLDALRVIPPAYDTRPAPSSVDWTPLLREAGLDPASLEPAVPEWTPDLYADARAAWTGTYEGDDAIPVRIEAASFRGLPVYFQKIPAWTKPPDKHPVVEKGQIVVASIATGILLLLFVGGSLLARRNLVRGRGDLSGSNHLAIFVFFVVIVTWVFQADHVASFPEMALLLIGLSWSAFMGGLCWTSYMALEPFIRRRWPQALVTWSRVLQGRIRDPLVGRDVLIGLSIPILLAGALEPLVVLYNKLSGVAGEHPAVPQAFALLRGTPRLLGEIAPFFAMSILAPFVIVFVIMAFRLVFRRDWMALGGPLLVFTIMNAAAGEAHASIAVRIVTFAVIAIVLVRFGLLTIVALTWGANMLDLTAGAPVRFGSWDGAPLIVILLIFWGMAVWAFVTAMGGRKLVSGEFLEE